MKENDFYNTKDTTDGFMPILRLLNDNCKNNKWKEIDNLLDILFVQKMSNTALTGVARFLYNDRIKLSNYFNYFDRVSEELDVRGVNREEVLRGLCK